MKTNDLIEILQDDIVSHGLFLQYLERLNCSKSSSEYHLVDVLNDLLRSGKVEIGNAKMVLPDHVEFVAWNGSVDERVERSVKAVIDAVGSDKEFAYWLSLRENVDRFE